MNIHLTLDSFDAATKEEIIERSSRYFAAALAHEQQLSIIHKGIKGLAQRLDIGEDQAAALLAAQKIHYSLTGKKGYVITEASVREYLKKK